MCVCVQWCPTLYDPMDCITRLICPQNSPGKNTGVGWHFQLQTYCLLTIKSTNYFFYLLLHNLLDILSYTAYIKIDKS